MKRILSGLVILLVLTAVLILPQGTGTAAAATQSQAQVSAIAPAHAAAFDKTRFVLHLAVAAFVIHYVYKKWKEGKLSHFHLFTDLKAVAALLIGYHELKVAYGIAKSSKSKTLQALVAPIKAAGNALSAVGNGLKHGSTSGISALNSKQSILHSVASKNGFNFSDKKPANFGSF